MEKADFNLENALKTFAAGENYHAEQLLRKVIFFEFGHRMRK